MLNVKKALAVIMILVFIAGCLSGCSGSSSSQTDSDKLQIITTIFPEYDWVRNVIGDCTDRAEVTLLLDNGTDLHSYQPTAKDILKISTCDLFIYVGGESDEWVEDALKNATNKEMTVINLLETLGDNVKEEEVVEGMQGGPQGTGDVDHHDEADDNEHHDEGGPQPPSPSDHSEEDDNDTVHHHEADDDHEHHHHEGEIEYDEHVWLSLRNASLLTNAIADTLGELDPSNAEAYKKNADAYAAKLADLDNDYKAVTEAAPVKTLLFGDRFPFRYLVDDYGLKYYAAFVGCSAETEASFETITFLAGKVDELSLHCVMTIERSDNKIAETIIKSSTSKDQKILTLDSLQSVTSKEVESGTTYLGVMESNLSVLKEALK
ncbi:MAG: zinc ABC transporter substrate-binding protein [Lachnospiraceae bacterium]|nr:zinc ABC transporter substrate-binding protein [Lachnospiraceae bacterium]